MCPIPPSKAKVEAGVLSCYALLHTPLGPLVSGYDGCDVRAGGLCRIFHLPPPCVLILYTYTLGTNTYLHMHVLVCFKDVVAICYCPSLLLDLSPSCSPPSSYTVLFLFLSVHSLYLTPLSHSDNSA